MPVHMLRPPSMGQAPKDPGPGASTWQKARHVFDQALDLDTGLSPLGVGMAYGKTPKTIQALSKGKPTADELKALGTALDDIAKGGGYDYSGILKTYGLDNLPLPKVPGKLTPK